jgi:N-acetylmuramoyl-L-alanine amidase
MGKYTIAIDAGHFPACVNGGSQGYKEGKSMMVLAKLLFAELAAYKDITPYLTRTDTDDSNPNNEVSLDERGRRAGKAGAHALFSLHSNAGGGRGTEVYYSLKQPNDKAFAALLCTQIAAALGISNRGAKTRLYPDTTNTDYYGIIREPLENGVSHAFIIEHAFHDNTEEERLLMDQNNLAKIAKVEAVQIAAWLGVSAKKEETNGRTAITGNTAATAAQMRAYLLAVNPQATEYAAILPEIYVEEAGAEGIRADVAFAQSCLETGNFKFGGDVKPDQNNFAGIGATGGVTGNRFATPREGIRAQIQHLKAYANAEPLKGTCIDPRFKYVARASAPYVEWLGIQENPNGKGWATGAGYGGKILAILAAILSTKPAVPVETIKAGSTVKLKQGAKTYTGGTLASFVYARNHVVKEINGERVVITYGGVVVAAVKLADLTLVKA